MLRDVPTEDISSNQVRFDFDAIDTVKANISRRIYELTKMYLVVLDGNKTYQMSPVRHFGVDLELNCTCFQLSTSSAILKYISQLFSNFSRFK